MKRKSDCGCEEGWAFVGGIVLGFLVAAILIGGTSCEYYRGRAVANGAASYNSSNGHFEWKDRK